MHSFSAFISFDHCNIHLTYLPTFTGREQAGGTGSAIVSVGPVSSLEDQVEALGVICDLLSDTMADTLLQAYHVHRESIEKSASTVPKKRKADWETAMEVLSTMCMRNMSCQVMSGHVRSSCWLMYIRR
jgi:hypothetical protein